MSDSDTQFMSLALKLARLGGRDVAPNPMVGAVIVKNGKVIGKGCHKIFGGPHAEVNAIRSVHNKSDLKGATMYVTLEPCRHYGKTPPCLSLIEAVGIARVICGSYDPFLQKLGTLAKGLARRNSELETLNASQRSSAAELETLNSKSEIVFLKGGIAEQCTQLNKFFFNRVNKKRPFVTVKIAMSADEFVAGPNGKPVRFTNAKQDREVHQMRAEHQAIMVGINTVLNDDPLLTVRHVKGKNPLRIILDSKLRLPKTARVLQDSNYLIATTKKSAHRGLNVWVSPTKNQVSLKKLFQYLADIGISSVFVEPGPTLYRSLKKQGLIDELVIYKSNKKLGTGLRLQSKNF